MKPTDYKNQLLIVEDKITKFRGKVVGHADYITGCDQYLVQPDAWGGEWKEGRWFDEGRLKVVSIESATNVQAETGDGADIPAPIK